MKRDFILNRIIKVMLLVLSMIVGQNAWAENMWTVTNPTGSTFRINRPDSHVGTTETVRYRTVNLSAYAGQHYTAVNSKVTFGVNDTYKEVTVMEMTPSQDAYKYQNGDSRKYRFDVTDLGGFHLAHCDREITTGTSVPNSGMFNIKDVTIEASEYTADDRGYDKNGYKYVAASSYCTSGTQAYLGFLNAQLRMTLSFDAKENDDAYEYLQILFGNTSTCDNRSGAGNGNPGTPSLSRYMAGFEMNTGAKDDTYRSYTFPVTSVGYDASATNPWGYGTDYPLTNQKFKSGYRATDGRLIVPVDFSSIVLRLNASGGSGSDEWAAKNVIAHIQAVDGTAPTKSAVSVNPGRHAKGNKVYVSVAFSEIVTVTGTPTLSTTSDNHWGSLSYVAGSGTNVLTFSTTIPQDATGALNITGLSGTVKDLAGNSLAGGTVTANSLCTLDVSYAYSISYELDGGTMATENLATYTYETATFTLNNPTRTGYTFAGWTGSNGNTPQTTVTIAAGSYDNKSYTANWTANTYTVTLDNQSATSAGTTSVTATFDAAMPAISVPAKTGYMFWGYYTGTDGGGTKYYNADGTSAHDWDIDAATILYAWWIITYIDADGIEQTCTDFTLIESHEGNVELGNIKNNEKWYAVNGPVTINGQLKFKDKNIHLILCDGASLTVNCATMHAIFSYWGDLTIYGQSAQSGTVNATSDSVSAIHSIDDVIINGGTVTATSNSASAILSLENVIINGGTVTASGYYGINAKDNVIINGGTVTAHCSNNYYAIYSYNNVTINGGIINADSPNKAIYAYRGTLTLGWTNATDRITASSYGTRYGTIQVKAGQAFYDGTDYYTGTLSTDQINTMAGKTLQPAVTYIDENGQEQYRTDFTVLSDATIPIDGSDWGKFGTYDQDTWYVATGSYTFDHDRLGARGHVHLILMDDAVFNVNGNMYGIFGNNGSKLSIYGQRQGTGQLNASTSAQSNGQGAINVTNNLAIYGGTISTTTVSGDGITADGNITINGGTVNATGASDGILAYGNITLGWTNATDRITASSYGTRNGTIQVKAGQAFYDGTDFYTDTLSTDQINTMAGKTLQPAVTYSITLPEHVSASGTVTRLNGTTYAPAGATVTLSTETGNNLSSVTVNGTPATDNGDGTWSFIMPAQDVTVAMPPVTYIDADGTEQSCTYYTLLTSYDDISNATNNQGNLPGGWYVVDGDIDCPYYLQFSGDVHIILADGARLYVHDGINSNGYDLTIYGQAAGSGELSVRVSIYYCNNICINGGTINIEKSNNHGIQANGNVTINGGTINIENSNNYGIQAYGNVTINGGTINIEKSNNAGIRAVGNVTINGGTLSFIRTDGIWASNVILGTSTSLKTLNITNGIYVYKISLDRTFTVGKPATVMLPFYMDVNKISGGTFYTFGGVEKENDRWVATMNAVTDYIEPNAPYLVMPTETSLRFTDETNLCTEGGGGGQTADEGSNWTFKGTYDYIKWTTDTSDPDYTAERAAEIGRVYGFAGVQKDGIEVGDFVKVASGARIRPMSAYLMWSDTPNAQNAPMRGSSRTGSAQELPQSITVRLLDASGTVTNVGEIDTVTGEISFEGWYTLQGVKLEAEPTEPGIYINKGKTVSIQK